MQIGAIAGRTGINIETIRYYERVGVLPRPPRSSGGHRVYTQADERRLTFVKRSRELGFSLDEVRALLALAEGGERNCAEVYGLAVGHLDDIRRKLADLQRMERALKSLAAECAHGTIPHCPMIEALSSPTNEERA
jgi:MerR family transcriptional regulator, mercuric resistance operon regulatory protein